MDKYERHRELCRILNETYVKKNHDYGDSFHLSYLEEGMAMPRIRLSDKLNRFKTLSKGVGREVADESMVDTLLDLANYALMTVIEIQEQEETCREEVCRQDVQQEVARQKELYPHACCVYAESSDSVRTTSWSSGGNHDT